MTDDISSTETKKETNSFIQIPGIEVKTTPQDLCTFQNSHGYTVVVKKTPDNSTVIIDKTLNLDTDNAFISSISDAQTTIMQSFRENRFAIIDFEGLFFYHYAQVLSSFEKQYPNNNILKDILPKLVKKYFRDSSDNLQSKKIISDEFKNAIQESCVSHENIIDPSQVNKVLNTQIKPIKDEIDRFIILEIKQKLPDSQKIELPQKIRKSTNAFNAQVMDTTTSPIHDNKKFIEKFESTTITSHDKDHGPSMTKVTMQIEDNKNTTKTVYEAYRTSHLVSNLKNNNKSYSKLSVAAGILMGAGAVVLPFFPPAGLGLIGLGGLILLIKKVYQSSAEKRNQQKAQEQTYKNIKELMDNSAFKENTTIYQLLTSTHVADWSPIGVNDSLTNNQTERLRVLIRAQYQYNTENKNNKKMFLTFNTPTNTFGQEISLNKFPAWRYPEHHQLAQTNLIALAVILYGDDNEQVIEMKTAYLDKDSKRFEKAYNQLKNAKEDISNEDPAIKDARQFLYERFKEDSAATHQYAKETASFYSILTKDKVNLILGCKSGNERTGGILGRVAAFYSDIYQTSINTNDSNVNSNQTNSQSLETDSLVSNAEQPQSISKKLNQSYHKRWAGPSATTVSRIDQGSDPKTGAKSGKWSMNTNKTEDSSMTNIKTGNMSQLQSHKDKVFKKSSTTSWFRKILQSQKSGSQDQVSNNSKENLNTSMINVKP